MVLQFPLPFVKGDNMVVLHPVEDDHHALHNMGPLPKPKMHKATTLEEDHKVEVHRAAEETISVGVVVKEEEEEVNTLGWVKEHH